MAQPAIQWGRTIGGNSSDNLIGMQATADGGYILSGTSASGISGDKSQSSRGGADFWIVKVSANGTKEWDKTIGGLGAEIDPSIHQTSDGGFILGGTSNSAIGGEKSENSRGELDYWIVKLDKDGNKVWDKTIGSTNRDVLVDVRQTADGSYILGGRSTGGVGGDKTGPALGTDDYWRNVDYWVVKLSATGSIVWDKTLGTSEFSDMMHCMTLTSDGGIVFAGGDHYHEYGDSGYKLMKMTADGTIVWERVIQGTDFAEIYDIEQTPDNGFILGGTSYQGAGGDQTEDSAFDYWIVKLNPDLSIAWNNVLNTLFYDQGKGGNYFVDLAQTPDGGYALLGSSTDRALGDKTQNSHDGSSDFWLVKLNASGTQVWDKVIGGSSTDNARSIISTSDGGLMLAGESGSDSSFEKTENRKGGSDFWIVKLAAEEPLKTLALSADSLVFTGGPGIVITPQAINLAPGAGMPNLTFLQIDNNQGWLTLPANTTGNSFSFSLTESGQQLPPGTYKTTITILAQGYARVLLPVTLVKLPFVSEEASNTYLRINAGGDAYAASNGRQFKADQYYTGIDRTSSVAEGDILNTTDDALYRSGRSSPSFGYKIPVANGKVNVVLHFAEIWFKQAGKRKFHVNIEGSRKLTDYDIYARAGAGGAMRAITQTIPVTVTDGMLNIDFLTGTADQPRISAIEVLVSSITLKAVEDTYVRGGKYENTTYGNEPNLDVKTEMQSSDLIRMTYLKFNVATVGKVGSAKLRVYGYNYENAKKIPVHVFGLDDDSWKENSLKYINRRSFSSPPLSSVGVTNVAQYYDLDVTSYMKARQPLGDTIISFVLEDINSRNTRLTFNSSENNVNPPQLVITPAPEANAAARMGMQEITANLEQEPGQSTVFPNPATKRFTIELSGKHSENIDLDLINQNGQSYKIQLPEKARAGEKAKVDVSNYSLSTGIYMLKIKSEAATEVIKMLITE